MLRKDEKVKKDPLEVFAKKTEAEKRSEKKSWFSWPKFFSKDKATPKIALDMKSESKDKKRVTLEGELAKLQEKKAATTYAKSLLPKTAKEKKAEERKENPDIRKRVDKALKATEKKGRFRP